MTAQIEGQSGGREAGQGVGCAAVGGAPASAGLPCLPREQQHWEEELPRRYQRFHRRVRAEGKGQKVKTFKWHPRDLRGAHDTRRKVGRVLGLMEQRFGVERLLFVTVTFPDKVLDRGEAYRRFHSFCTNVLSREFDCWVLAVGRHEDGGLHVHLTVVAPVDVRTGFDFVAYLTARRAAKRRDWATVAKYTPVYAASACSYLRDLWGRMRTRTNYNGKHPEHPYPKIGRVEFVPVRVGAGAVAAYIGRYLRKQFGTRFPEDKGARLARFSRAAQLLDDEYWAPIKENVRQIRVMANTMAQRPREQRRRGVTCSRVEWRPEWRGAFGVPFEVGGPLYPF